MSKNTKVIKVKRTVGRPRIHPVREKGPVGRPRNKPIMGPRPTGKRIEMMIACKMTPASIAMAIGCTEEELKLKYSDELLHGAERFKADLIHMIWETADRGNVQATILLNNIMSRASLDVQPKLGKKLGKKALAQAEAERLIQSGSWLAPSSPPRLIIDNSEKPKRR